MIIIANTEFKSLTVGKKYSVIREDKIGYLICSDAGLILWYTKDKFIRLRDINLDLLL